jgi:hypothetical protein
MLPLNKCPALPLGFRLLTEEESKNYILKAGDAFISNKNMKEWEIVDGWAGNEFSAFKKVYADFTVAIPIYPEIPKGYQLVESPIYVTKLGDFIYDEVDVKWINVKDGWFLNFSMEKAIEYGYKHFFIITPTKVMDPKPKNIINEIICDDIFPVKQKGRSKLPDNFKYIRDDKYVLTSDDMVCQYGNWFKVKRMAGKTIEQVKGKRLFYKYKFASPKPRFKNARPFPYGY